MARFRQVAVGIFAVVSAVLYAGCSSSVTPSADVDSPQAVQRQVSTYDPALASRRLASDVAFLADDARGGRPVRSRGLEESAEFLAGEFQRIGLQPLEGRSYYQPFAPRRRLRLGRSNSLAFIGQHGRRQAEEPGDVYMPLAISRVGTFDLPLVFVGYGITAPEHHYDDYANVDVKGKGVVVLRHEPSMISRASRSQGAKYSSHAYLTTKIENAARHGAEAVFFCTDRHAVETGESERLLPAETLAGQPRASVFVLHVARRHMDAWLEHSGLGSLMDFETAIGDPPRPNSRELLGLRAVGEVSFEETTDTLKNVVGLIAGQGALGEQAVVIGAHYDHIGMGGGLSLSGERAVHNGADDNASGTAVLLEIARQVKNRLGGEHRTVVFVAFTAEEIGLVGSDFYARHPATTPSRTVAMVNLDMVGRMREDRLLVLGTEENAFLFDLIRRHAGQHGIRVVRDVDWYGLSDHANFALLDIPAVHLFTGMHGDYHRPSDDVEKLNIDGMAKVAQLVTGAVRELATASQLPRPAERLARSDQSSDRLASSSFLGRPLLGIQVADARDGPGALVRRVISLSPAADAQLAAGDVILRIDETAVSDADQLRSQIAARRPGDRVKLLVQRDELQLEVAATLGTVKTLRRPAE